MIPTHNTKVKYHDGKDKETENNTQLYQNINFLNLFAYQQGPSWPWSYGSWIYIYICNHLPITTDVVGLTPAKGEDPVQHYVIQFVSDLRQVSGFLRVLMVSSTNKTDLHDKTEILLKVAFNTNQPT